MKLLRTLLVPVVCLCAIAQTLGPEGVWFGVIASGATKLRVVMRITRTPLGTYMTSLDSLDQGATGIPVDSTSIRPDGLKLELSKLAASFDGKFSEDLNSIAGVWTQSGGSVPLTFKRSSDAEIATLNPKGKPITAEDRAALVSQFERTLNVFLDAVSGVTEAQAKFKPGPDRWSVLEIAEHLAVTEDFLFDYATKNVTKILPKPEVVSRTPDALKAADEKIVSGTVDRTKKGKSPPPMQPSGRYPTLEAAVAALKEKRAKVITYAKSTQDDLRDHATVAPNGQTVDAYEYLLILALHTERHSLQIKEVKADPAYPK